MLIITLGDPFSVNIELLSHVLAASDHQHRVPVVIVGSAWHWAQQRRLLGCAPLPVQAIASLQEATSPGLYLVDVSTPTAAAPAETLPETVRGQLSVLALEWLRQHGTHAKLAVVTGAIDKHACAQVGFRYGGQTEFFEELWQGEAIMILAGARLKVGLVTNHLALRDVPRAINPALVASKLTKFVDALRETWQLEAPRVAVCGLNPHAGDQGLFGDEESLCLAPALAEVRAKYAGSGVEIVGPVPADTAFYRAYHGQFSGVLAMYHDQGLGPLKTVHFDDAVNLSGGLRHFRASPDHGPARDLFLKKQASPASFALALQLAINHLHAR